MLQKGLIIILLCSLMNLYSAFTAYANTNSVQGLLNVKVLTVEGSPISNAQLIVINSFGEIIETKVTDSHGKAKVKVAVPIDKRFPTKNLGSLTIIAVANGYNEHINFSVPINEFSNNLGNITITLSKIEANKRNELSFINGGYHRFTVFEMLDYYATQIGLKRQNIANYSIKPAPWGPNTEAQQKK